MQNFLQVATNPLNLYMAYSILVTGLVLFYLVKYKKYINKYTTELVQYSQLKLKYDKIDSEFGELEGLQNKSKSDNKKHKIRINELENKVNEQENIQADLEETIKIQAGDLNDKKQQIINNAQAINNIIKSAERDLGYVVPLELETSSGIQVLSDIFNFLQSEKDKYYKKYDSKNHSYLNLRKKVNNPDNGHFIVGFRKMLEEVTEKVKNLDSVKRFEATKTLDTSIKTFINKYKVYKGTRFRITNK